MKILLDENFPLARVGKLRDEGQEVDHIILLGLRGTHDSAIVQRLNSEELLFVTCDQEFFDLPVTHSVIMISRVAQVCRWRSDSTRGSTRSANISRIRGAKTVRSLRRREAASM
jgi:hypothetical protein